MMLQALPGVVFVWYVCFFCSMLPSPAFSIDLTSLVNLQHDQ